ARATRISASLSADAIRRGDVILDDVRVSNPVVSLRESGGGWNFEQVFEELLSGENGNGGRAGPKRTIQLRNVRIDDGVVDVTRPADRFAFRCLEARLPMGVVSRPGVAEPSLRAATMEAQFVQAEPGAQVAIAVTDGRFVFPSGTVRFDVAGATIDRTR